MTLKLYSVEDGDVTYWVAAPDVEVARTLTYNFAVQAGECDPATFVFEELTEATALGLMYHGEGGSEESVEMWTEFLSSLGARVIACSEY